MMAPEEEDNEMPSWEGQNAGGLYSVLQFFMSVPKN